MKRRLQIAGILLGVLCFVGGLLDVYLQYLDGETIQWRVPLILIGTGIGLPLVIFPFFEWGNRSEQDFLDEDGSVQFGVDGFGGDD